ncbi:testis-specific gene A8 protein-like [Schistocerca americana]|uniref:testis-specific gene A8 protein-like n=1 Tax=Schistocerca americana TaxID=7009 RepID=UPI001F4FC9E9|nr:testis-specific gene A8 protein-like [Schistocerca americana]
MTVLGVSPEKGIARKRREAGCGSPGATQPRDYSSELKFPTAAAERVINGASNGRPGTRRSDAHAPSPTAAALQCPPSLGEAGRSKAAAGQAAQPPLGKAARLRGRRPSAPKAVATEEGPQAPERPPGALPDEAAREASTGRAVGVVAATAAAAALEAAAKSEGAAGTRRGPNLWTKNERQNPGGQRGATGSDASCAPQ